MKRIINFIFILSIFNSCINPTKTKEQTINLSETDTIISNNMPKISFDSMKVFYLKESSHCKDSIMADIKILLINPPMKKGKEFDIDIKEYLNKALKKGDTEAYDFISYELTMFAENRYLPYAIYMADKHHYENAYDDVFRYFTELSIKNLDSLISVNHINIKDVNRRDVYNLEYISPGQRALALIYLIKGAENGSNKSRRILKDYYLRGKYFPKDNIPQELLNH